MRSKGTCVPGVAALVVVALAGVCGLALWQHGVPYVAVQPLELSPRTLVAAGSPETSQFGPTQVAASVRIQPPPARTAPRLASSISSPPSIASAPAIAQASMPRSIGDLPVVFEANVGQGPTDAQFAGRGSGAEYALTRDGIRISSARSTAAGDANDRALTLRFVDARSSLVSAPQSSGNSHKRRSRSRSHARSGRKPRSSRRSSHPAGDRQSRPHDVPKPSAFDPNSAARREFAQMNWKGTGALATETNYFLGNDPRLWHTHVSNFSEVAARDVVAGVDVTFYGTRGGAEYDVRVAPGADPASVRVALDTPNARWVREANGDLSAAVGATVLRMHKPVAYDLIERSANGGRASQERRTVATEFALAPDGTVGFAVRGHDPHTTLVIDPSLTISYFTFLGGSGTDSATSVAVDSSGFVYVGGTTTLLQGWGVTSQNQGNASAGSSVFFVAKINPSAFGAASLVYLTFIGGTGAQLGGKIAVNPAGDVLLAGTTTAHDYPVTDGSMPTIGAGGRPVNDVAISELTTNPSAPGVVTLAFSTLFGGNGNEAQVSPGGVAITSAGVIFVAMDTTSTNLPVYPPATTNSDGTTSGGPYQPAYAGGQTDGEGDGGNTDGFLVEYATPVQFKSTIKYCTYLGIYAQSTVTGLALDSAGNAYLAGYTSDPNGSFATTNGLPGPGPNAPPLSYAGGASDGFVMKILPSGNGAQDLSYGTFLGGSGSDQALAIAVSTNSLPGTVYVTGTTQSTDFPLSKGTALQTCLGLPGQTACSPASSQTSNAFLTVISQAPTFSTSLVYSTYLGGSRSDQGNAVFYGGANQIFVAGNSTSWDFPWFENLQPMSGVSDAFFAEIDPTSSGNASLLLASPLGGSYTNATSAAAHGNAIAADTNGNVYVAGDTNETDFPLTQTPGNGVESSCVSCANAASPSDGFIAVVAVSPEDAPAVKFNTTSLRFNPGVDAPQAVALINSGSATLTITNIEISPAASGFAISGPQACLSFPANVQPGSSCSFEVSYSGTGTASVAGDVVITDNAAGGVQSLPLYAAGSGAEMAAVPSTLNFGTVAVDPPLPAQQQVRVTNSGAVPLANPVLILSGSSVFTLGADNCEGLNAGATCTIMVNFTPTAEATYAGQLTLTYTPFGSQQTVQSVVTYGGIGGAGSPAAAISPTSLAFSAQAVGTTGTAETVTITNNGTAKLTMGGAALSGSGAAAFSFTGTSGGGCVASGAALAVGASCTFNVSFSPAAAGSYAASLSISDNAPTSPQIVQLSGSGIAPSLSIAPTSASFGTATMGITSTAVPVVLTNGGASTITVSSITVTGADAADFSAPNNCVPAIAAGKTCTINLSFNPTGGGTRTAAIQIADNAPNSPQSIAVSGSAVSAQIGVSPASFGFGGQLANTASAAETFTVTNTAPAPAMLSVTSAAVTDSTDFQVTNSCTKPVAASGTCTISVVFDPGTSTQSSSRTGTLVIASNSAANAQTSVKLTGSAADFELGPASSGGASVTVTGRTTATYSLDLTSLGGFTGSPSITCTSTDALPGPCVTPSTVTATANGQTAFTVTVGTSADAASRRIRATTFAPPRSRGAGRSLPVRSLFALIAMCAVTLAAWLSLWRAAPRSGQVSRLHFALGVVTVTLLAGLTLVACGGGGGANSDPPPPTGGTYTLTITATSGGTSRTLPLTLTVD